MNNIIIEQINSDNVYLNYTEFDQTKQIYNTNNHWVDGVPPNDYMDVIKLTNAEHWIDKFKTYNKIVIDPKEISWLLKAYELGQHTFRFPHFFDDELESLLKSHSHYNYLFEHGNKGYFVRCNNVSLKYGKNGVGPYYDLKSIIESTVTTKFGHSPLYLNTTSLEYYLIDWVNIIADKEFRVFVYDNEITCISQQSTTKPNDKLKILSETDRDSTIKEWIKIIYDYWNTTIKTNITHISNYSIDIAILDDNTPYFIEINSFGAEYAAGSALFHWIIDREKLYNKTKNIYFRYSI